MMEFFTRYKKIFILIGFLLTVFALGYLMYATFFKPVPPEVPIVPPEEIIPPTGLPTAEEGEGQIITPTEEGRLPTEIGIPQIEGPSEIAKGGITKTDKLSDALSMDATLSSNGSNLQFYNKDDGKFYQIDKNGDLKLMADKVFHSVEKVTWSSSKNKAILEYPDGANIIYDFSTNRQVTLPKHWEDFDFSPNGSQIVMKSLGLDPNNRWLAIVNDDGSKVKAIESMGENEATVYPSWSPNGQSIAMHVEGVGFDRQEIFFIGQNEENFKSTVVEGRGFQPKWQPDGNKLLYSVYSSQSDLKPSIWVVNAKGENIGSGRKNLNIETWADKCTFTNDSELYCAVPENLEKGSGLFPEMAENTKDNLYKIDTQTGMKKLIAVPDGSYNMSNIIISDNEYYLYFTDKITGKLHKIKLK